MQGRWGVLGLFPVVVLLCANPVRAADITIDASGFSVPISHVTLSVYQGQTGYMHIGGNRFFFNGSATFALPDGSFTLSAYQGTPVFGGFTISGGQVTATSGGLTQTGPTGLAALPSALTRVELSPSALSVPAASTTVRLSSGISGVAIVNKPMTFFLPDATFNIATYSTDSSFGAFTVSGGSVSGATGALIASGNTVGFDTTQLAGVRVHSSQLTSTAFIVHTVRINDTSGVFVINSNDPLLYLPDGAFEVTTYSTVGRYGSFVVSGRQVVSTAGSLTLVTDGIGFDRSTLAQVTFNLAPLTNPPSAIAYRVTHPGAGVLLLYRDGTAWLPAAEYSITDYSTAVTLGTISVTGTSFVVSGGLEAVAGTVQARRCGLAVVDVTSPVLATLEVPYTGYRNAFRVSLPAGQYSLKGNTAQPLGTFDISPALRLTTANLAPGVNVQLVSCVQDGDGDGIEDGADNCPTAANPDQNDQDLDGLGDVCDPDLDGDDVPDAADNCLGLTNTDQFDSDVDGLGDACDLDDDGDGLPDGTDNCALISNPDQRDSDADGQGDACDGDVDGDGVLNDVDACPATSPGLATNGQGCGGIELVALRCVEDNLRTHGQYVACVASEARAAQLAGLISGAERARLVAQAARHGR